MLWENDVFDVKEGGGDYVSIMVDGIVVKGCVFGCYDG